MQKAAELNPHLPEVYSYLGSAHIQTGDTATARLGFQKELEQNPNDFESNLQLAALLKQDQDYERRAKMLDRALRVRPGDMQGAVSTRLPLTLPPAGSTLRGLGWRSILKQAPQFVEAHISLATVYYRLQRKADGDREKALAQKLTDGDRESSNLRRRTNEARDCSRWRRGPVPSGCWRWRPPVPATRRPGFVDVAPKSKIPYTTNNSFAGRKYFPQPMCGGVAHLRFRQRRQDGHLLHQRRQTAGAEEDRILPISIACCTRRATELSKT